MHSQSLGNNSLDIASIFPQEKIESRLILGEASQTFIEEMVPKGSPGDQCMCLLQGPQDSEEHFPGKSGLNPLQNRSSNCTSACPCQFASHRTSNHRIILLGRDPQDHQVASCARADDGMQVDNGMRTDDGMRVDDGMHVAGTLSSHPAQTAFFLCPTAQQHQRLEMLRLPKFNQNHSRK